MRIVGHRGARGLAPENTLQAVEAGIQTGADAIEVDLRLSSDGHFAVHHNPDFMDKNGARHFIKELPVKELHALLSNTPTLEAIVERVLKGSTKIELVLHCKDRHFARKLNKEFEKFKLKGYDIKRVMVLSFYARELALLKKLQPECRIYYLFRYALFFHLLVCKLIGAEGAGYNWRYTTTPLVWFCHRHGLKIAYYTVNEPAIAKVFKHHGLDYLTTDRPDIIIKSLKKN